jgi:hypothetical protein
LYWKSWQHLLHGKVQSLVHQELLLANHPLLFFLCLSFNSLFLCHLFIPIIFSRPNRIGELEEVRNGHGLADRRIGQLPNEAESGVGHNWLKNNY